MLAGKADILHADAFRQLQPFVRIELYRVELVHQRFIFPAGHPAAPENLLMPRRDAVKPPVDEQSEPFLLEPVPAVIKSKPINHTGLPPFSVPAHSRVGRSSKITASCAGISKRTRRSDSIWITPQRAFVHRIQIFDTVRRDIGCRQYQRMLSFSSLYYYLQKTKSIILNIFQKC